MSVDYRSINARSSSGGIGSSARWLRPYVIGFVIVFIQFSIYGAFSTLHGSSAVIGPLPIGGNSNGYTVDAMSMVTGEKKMTVMSTPSNVVEYTALPNKDTILQDSLVIEADPKKLTFVWEMIACGTGGFQTEIIDIVMGLYEENIFGRLGIYAPVNCWPPGLPQETVNILEFLRKQPMERWKIDMFVRHAPPSNYIFNFPHLSLQTRPAVMIGRSMVEIDAVDESMIANLKHVDDVWVPSKHSLEGYLKMGAPAEKFYTVHEPIQAELYDRSKTKPLPLPGLRGFNFLSIFKWEGRKGVDILLRSFFEEFTADDDVTLIIQSHQFGARSPYRPEVIRKKISNFVEQQGLQKKKNALPLDRIIVISERVPQSDMLRIYRTADAFVLPTHGEGWGQPIIEAMTMEVPTIATDYSGIREYLNEETGFPIRVTGLEPAMGLNFEAWMRWASVDVTHFKKLMRDVYNMSPEARAKVGKKARDYIATHFTRAKIAEQVAMRAKELMVKFKVPGSALQVCQEEMTAERHRARLLNIPMLGDKRQLSQKDVITDLSKHCNMHDKRKFYKQWEGRASILYSSFPQTSALDNLSPHMYHIDTESEAYKEEAEIYNLSMTSPYVTAFGMHNIFLLDSKVETDANVVSWEERHKDDLVQVVVSAPKLISPKTSLDTLSTYIRRKNSAETDKKARSGEKEENLQKHMKDAAKHILRRKTAKSQQEYITPRYNDSPERARSSRSSQRSTGRYDYSGDGYGDTFGYIDGEDDD